MATAVWTGTLSFGLITLPVRLYPATQPKDVRFHLYDREGRRIRYQRVVETDETSPGSDRSDPPRTEREEEEAPFIGGGEPERPTAPVDAPWHGWPVVACQAAR